MHPLVRRLRHLRPVRAAGIPLYQMAARRRPGAPPRVLANSLPKAGTHLLTSLLRELPDMRFSGEHLTAYDVHDERGYRPTALRARLGRIRDGQYVSAHLPAAPEVLSAVADLGYACVFIIRDPRDAVVSDMFYILSFPRHPLHATLTAIPTPEERLATVIRGLPDTRSGVPLLEPTGDRLDNYGGWLDAPGTCVVRFEDLVGSRGGGDAAAQLRAVTAVASHVGRELEPDQARAVADRIWSPRSSTFRRGVSGEWRRHFTPEHVALLKATAGKQLVRYGYERDLDWS